MFCKNCGSEISDEAIICPACGVQTGSKMMQPGVKSNNHTVIILAIVLAVLLFLAVAVGGFFLITSYFNQKEAASVHVTGNETVGDFMKPPVSAVTEKGERPSLDTLINRYISSVNGMGNISVAVLDNKTGETYYSSGAQERYTAWGFYLPVYLAYEYSGFQKDYTLLNNVMSSDPGVCNQAGNHIINIMGGPAGISQSISRTFRSDATVFERYFAETNTARNNYTNAKEAVMFLNCLNDTNDFDALSYNVSDFGIDAPMGARMYAQVGTENKQVRNQLNVFAIVKGRTSDYCVSVLTRNRMGNHISTLLEMIHTEMEGMYA